MAFSIFCSVSSLSFRKCRTPPIYSDSNLHTYKEQCCEISFLIHSPPFIIHIAIGRYIVTYDQPLTICFLRYERQLKKCPRRKFITIVGLFKKKDSVIYDHVSREMDQVECWRYSLSYETSQAIHWVNQINAFCCTRGTER